MALGGHSEAVVDPFSVAGAFDLIAAGPPCQGFFADVTRYIALLASPAPLAGRCPVCDGVMDESGCRLGEHHVSKDPERTRGIAQIVEVWCCGRPMSPVVECPAAHS